MTRVGLVAAAERHNVGDWLMAWTAQRLLGPEADVAWINVAGRTGVGMTERCGPFLPVWQAAAQDGWTSAPLVHVGGETLGYPLASALRTSLMPALPHHCDASKVGGLSRGLAYVTPARERVLGREVTWGPRAFFGVGGRDVGQLSTAQQDELVEALCTASWVSTRDDVSAANLDRLGVAAQVHPDLVSALPRVGAPLDPAPEPSGLVVQVAHALVDDWGAALVRALAPLADRYPHADVAVAGLAPHHDRLTDATLLAIRLEQATRPGWARPFVQVDPLRIADRIRSAELVVASSLHLRIIAMAYGVPAVSIGVPKALDYAAQWDLAPGGAAAPEELDAALSEVLEPTPADRRAHGLRLADQTLASWRRATGAVLHG